MNDRELYMLNALRAIASYGKEGKVVMRPYMAEHKLKWTTMRTLRFGCVELPKMQFGSGKVSNDGGIIS